MDWITWLPPVGGLPPYVHRQPRREVELCAPERTQRLDGRLVSAPHEVRPAAAGEEPGVERRAAALVLVDRLDQREPLAEPAAGTPGQLEVVGHLELPRGGEDAAAAALPAGDLLALEPGRQQHVQAEDMVEAAVGLERLRRERVNHAAVHV